MFLLAGTADGQILDFHPPHDVIGPNSLEVLQTFFVYSKEEAPSHDAGGHAYVKFHNVAVKEGSGKGLELSMWPSGALLQHIDTARFCCDDSMIEQNNCTEKERDSLVVSVPQVLRQHVYRHMLGDSADSRHTLLESGAYTLLLSNCGNLTNGQVTGRILLKNPHGFLPGDEIHKLRFYMQLTIAYVLFTGAWLYQAFKWWTELVVFQYAVSAVIFLGLLDALFSFAYYNDFNVSGTPAPILFTIASFFSVAKTMFTAFFVLMASMGVGITRLGIEEEQQHLRWFFGAWLISHVALAYLAVGSGTPAIGFWVKVKTNVLLTCVFMQATCLIWIIWSLTELIESLKTRRQTEKLLLFQRLFVIMAIVCAGSAFMLIIFIWRAVRFDLGLRWRDEWLFSDAGPHTMMFLTALGVAYLWAPSQYSKLFEFARRKGGGDDEHGDAPPGVPVGSQDVWAQEDSDDDNEKGGDTSLWAMSKADGESPFSDEPLVSKAEEPADPLLGGIEIIGGALVVSSAVPTSGKSE